VRCADAVLHEARRAWKQRVGRRRSDDDEVDVGGRQACAFDRGQRCFDGQVRRRDARIDDVAFADAGALQDPLVARLDQLLEIGVGEHPRRDVGGEAGNPCPL
jgi:hypothetical protein